MNLGAYHPTYRDGFENSPPPARPNAYDCLLQERLSVFRDTLITRVGRRFISKPNTFIKWWLVTPSDYWWRISEDPAVTDSAIRAVLKILLPRGLDWLHDNCNEESLRAKCSRQRSVRTNNKAIHPTVAGGGELIVNHSTRSTLDIQISNESSDDAEQVHQITEQAFQNAPHTDHTEQYIVNALRQAGALTISQIAKVDGEAVGHVAISPVTLSSGETGWFGLGPISVLPEYQGRGVGSKLIKSSLAALEEMDASGCVVLGDPGYYERFRFKVIDGLVYPGVPAEYFQALAFSDELPQGEVSYHEAFSAQG